MGPITVLDLLDDAAERESDTPYLVDEERSLSFRACRSEANRLGSALLSALDGTCRRPVIVWIDKSAQCVIAFYAVLASGNFYVPMDVKTPRGRFEAIVGAMEGARVLATRNSAVSLAKLGYDGEVLIYEDLLESADAELDAAPRAALADVRRGIVDVDLMYVLFTSGSTGVPKGVCVRHRSVVDYIEAFVSIAALDRDDVLGNQAPLYVDMSLRDLFAPLLTGSRVHLIPQRLFMTPKKLLGYLDDANVTTLIWVPTAYRLIAQFDALALCRPRGLAKLFFSGETMPTNVFIYWRGFYPDATCMQFYGPTEITGACTYFPIARDFEPGETIPIGRPFPNTGVLLVGEDGEVIGPEQPGRSGEICVYGSCLAAGYYHDDAKTAQAFVQNPIAGAWPSLMYRTGDLACYDDRGDLIYQTRRDHQIKHGGRRIELGEVERAFEGQAGVAALCCVHDRANDELVLYYVGDGDERALMAFARSQLPKYMIPTRYRRREALPTLPSGKLDRKRLDAMANDPSGDDADDR